MQRQATHGKPTMQYTSQSGDILTVLLGMLKYIWLVDEYDQ